MREFCLRFLPRAWSGRRLLSMQRVSAPSTRPAQPVERDAQRVAFSYPENLTAEERAEVDRTLDVDGEAYLRWLAGEGPDPCAPSE
jgi:hypothetical protein